VVFADYRASVNIFQAGALGFVAFVQRGYATLHGRAAEKNRPVIDRASARLFHSLQITLSP